MPRSPSTCATKCATSMRSPGMTSGPTTSASRCKSCNAGSPPRLPPSINRCGRRRERLELRLAEERAAATDGMLQRHDPFADVLEDDKDRNLDEIGGEELEDAEQAIADRATASRTIAELEAELVTLRHLEALADRLRRSGKDAKWRTSCRRRRAIGVGVV